MRDLNELEQEKYDELILLFNKLVEDEIEREIAIELFDELIEILLEE